jgi:hypothetical protein
MANSVIILKYLGDYGFSIYHAAYRSEAMTPLVGVAESFIKNRFVRKGSIMHRKMKMQFFTGTILGIIVAVILATPGISPCAGSNANRPKEPSTVNKGERPVHPGYPFLFDKIGRLDRITDNEAVISDSLYHISAAATYHTPRRGNASRSRFRVGDHVGCLINADGDIASLWLISRNSR